MNSVVDWSIAGAVSSVGGGLLFLLIKSGPEWLSIKAKKDNLNIETAARVQGMTIEYAEQLQVQLQACLAEVKELREELRLAHEENDHYKAQAQLLPPEYRRRFQIVAPMSNEA